jgi:hypothetical protein
VMNFISRNCWKKVPRSLPQSLVIGQADHEDYVGIPSERRARWDFEA